MKLRILVLAAIALAAACTSPTSSSTPTVSVPASFSMTGTGAQVETAASARSDAYQKVSLTLDLGSTARHVYFVLTNESATKATSGMPVLNNDVAVSSREVDAVAPNSVSASFHRIPTVPTEILTANANAADRLRSAATSRSVTVSPPLDSSPTPYTSTDVGSAMTSYIPYRGTSSSPVLCTLEALVDQSLGTQKRKLFVWVANDYLDASSTTYTYNSSNSAIPFKVNPTQAAAIASAFLNSSGNDIYGYDTSIYGTEYYDINGTPASSNLITPQGEIHIFIVDLNESDSSKGTGGTLGYFYAGDDYKSSVYSDSNEKIMFQLDAEMLGNPSSDGDVPGSGNLPSGGWSLSASYWPNQMLSTLAHEFQHMIHFYQKQVKQGASSTQTWINEMASMVTEDFVASTLHTLGPRGVQYTNSGSAFAYDPGAGNLYSTTATMFNDPSSRLAFFNQYYSSTGLETWGDTGTGSLANYGVAYAFGAWLARNYGGPQLFHNIVTNIYSDDTAVTNAVNTFNGTSLTMPQLIEQWAATMVMGSKAVTAPYSMANTSAYSSATIDYGPDAGHPFTYGSMDATKYYPLHYNTTSSNDTYLVNNGGGPRVYTNFSGVSSIPARAFYYYQPSTSALSGTRTFVVTIPPNVHFDVVTVP